MKEKEADYRELLVEWTCGLIAAASISPFVAIVDQSIISNASGRKKLLDCIKQEFLTLSFRPLKFVKQPAFLWVFGVYSATYVTGNSIEWTCNQWERSSFFPKFAGSSLVNVSLSVMKDRSFTRLFGVSNPKPLPLGSYGLFSTRDSLTVLAGFSLPPLVAKELEQKFSLHSSTSLSLSQLFVPCAMQFFSAPLHLLGLDLYNNTHSFQKRVAFIRREYWSTSFARISRILPAYGIGGIINRKLRNTYKEYLGSSI